MVTGTQVNVKERTGGKNESRATINRHGQKHSRGNESKEEVNHD